MSIIGKQGGDAKAQNAIKDRVAKAFISKNYGLLKIGAEKLLGIDVDDLIDEYGAENIMTALQDLAPKLGWDLSKGLGQGLNKSKVSDTMGVIP